MKNDFNRIIKPSKDEDNRMIRPLKILSITTVFPFPPDNGTKITIYHRLRWLSERNNVTMLCIHSNDIKQDHIDEMQKYCSVKLIRGFQSNNSKGIFQPAIKYFKSLWRKVPYFLEENISQEVEIWLNEQIRTGDFDLVEAENDCAVMYLNRHWNIFKVSILHSVNDASMRRQIRYERNLLKKIKAIAYWIVWRNYEKQIDRRIDLCVTLTRQNEQEILRLNPNIAAKNCVTNGVDLNYFQFQFSNEKPTGICFVGLMDYPPNVDAVIYCYQKIFPLIRNVHNDIKFYIVGSSPPTKVMQLAQDKMIEVIGYVEDIRPYLRKAGIAIVPTRMGGGILNKILEPLAMGIPVVTRSRSVEGLNVKNGVDLLIADNAIDFARAVIRLLNDESLRYRLAHNGRKYVENHHQWKKIIEDYELELRNQLKSYQLLLRA